MGRLGGWALRGKALGNGFGRRGRGQPIDYHAIAREREGYSIPTDLHGRPTRGEINTITGEPVNRWVKPRGRGRAYGNKLPRKY